jgi:hypothetical protein
MYGLYIIWGYYFKGRRLFSLQKEKNIEEKTKKQGGAGRKYLINIT